ncbi:hypothetical protein [Streptomyces sp. NPDC002580]|uniref:hypothetical protein n=1 Tax=Streptomyces sp. NPDC002580 TaxID=3364653 RepID=UPI00368602D7
MTPERIAEIREQGESEFRTILWADNVIDELLAEVERLQAAQAPQTDREDTAQARPADLSHAALVAVLMHHGGSLEVPAEAFEPDSIGGRDGSFHALALDTLPGGLVRLSVQPRPDVPDARIIREDGPR